MGAAISTKNAFAVQTPAGWTGHSPEESEEEQCAEVTFTQTQPECNESLPLGRAWAVEKAVNGHLTRSHAKGELSYGY
jgi:hypothetical protein